MSKADAAKNDSDCPRKNWKTLNSKNIQFGLILTFGFPAIMSVIQSRPPESNASRWAFLKQVGLSERRGLLAWRIS